jgi:hypothetical protein
VEEASHNGPSTALFHLYGTFRKGEYRETDGRLVTAQGWEDAGLREGGCEYGAS